MKDGDGPPGPGDSRSSPAYTILQWSVGDKSTTLEQLKKWHRIKSIMCPSCSITLIGEERTKNVSIRQSGTIVELQHSQCKVAENICMNHCGVSTQPMQGSKGEENICMQRMWIYIHTTWEKVVSTMWMPKITKSAPPPPLCLQTYQEIYCSA